MFPDLALRHRNREKPGISLQLLTIPKDALWKAAALRDFGSATSDEVHGFDPGAHLEVQDGGRHGHGYGDMVRSRNVHVHL